MELQQTVKDILNGNPADSSGAGVEAPAESALLKEIADLKVKLAAALEQGAMDAMKANRVKAVEAERDNLLAQVETLTAAQPMPVAVTTDVECSIQYDVKAPELSRWQNAGWMVKHYQFVGSGTSTVPALAVVLERPADTNSVSDSTYTYSVAPKADDMPRNTESAPVNEPVAHFTEIIIEAPEAIPAMAGKSLVEKLAQDKPIFAAIAEYGVDAVIDALDAKVMDVARAAYEAALPDDVPSRRFQSLIAAVNVNPDELVLEADEIEAVPS